MSIPNKQPGWNNITKLLWENATKAEKLIKIFATGFINIPDSTGTKSTTAYRLISEASVNANVIKAAPGNLYSISAIGLTETVKYLKFYNKATTPADTDIPVMTIPIPANLQGAGIVMPLPLGVNFNIGIGVRITSGIADNDTVSIDADEVVINLTYV
jgi:hypothetical protein